MHIHTHKSKNFLPGEDVFMYLPNRYRRYKLQSMSSSHPALCGLAPLDSFCLCELLDQPGIHSCDVGTLSHVSCGSMLFPLLPSYRSFALDLTQEGSGVSTEIPRRDLSLSDLFGRKPCVLSAAWPGGSVGWTTYNTVSALPLSLWWGRQTMSPRSFDREEKKVKIWS